MLTQLHIQNFGLIDDLTLEFTEGLNILTGATGAGKSIIIDGLRYALGGKLNTAHVRDITKPCTVEVIFNLSRKFLKCSTAFEEFSDDEGTVIIFRQYTPDGRTKIRVNGISITLTQLKNLGDQLMDFHGPHDHQQLLTEDAHRGLLDQLIDWGDIKNRYREAFTRYTGINRQLDELRNLSTARERELDLLGHQIRELEQVPLSEEKYAELSQDLQRINNAEKLYALTATALELTTSGENGLAELVRQTFAPLRSLQQIDDKTASFLDTLTEIQDKADDLIARLRDYQNQLSFEPDAALDISRRFDIYETIRRKYGPTITDAQQFYAEAKKRYDLLFNLENNQTDLAQELNAVESTLAQLAAEMSHIRQKSAKTLKRTIESELRELGIEHIVFEARVSKTHFHADGWDKVIFYISPNAGEELKPLAVIVSSGESARVMLAMKKALTKADPVPVLIFDEIDAQIGGRLGTITGRKLKELSADRQVILITHLPQIASFADQHIKIGKEVIGGRTVTTAILLDKNARIQELSQMLDGETTTTITVSHAKDMLEKAKKD